MLSSSPQVTFTYTTSSASSSPTFRGMTTTYIPQSAGTLPTALTTPTYPSTVYHALPHSRLPSTSLPAASHSVAIAPPLSPSDSDASPPSSPSSPSSPSHAALPSPSTELTSPTAPLKPAKARTLPNRGGAVGKRSATIGSRVRLWQTQQRSDGVYCVLNVVKRPKVEEEQEAVKPRATEGEEESGSSSSDSDDSSSSSSSSSAAPSPTVAPPRAFTKRQQRRLRRQQREEDAARARRAKARSSAPSSFVLNKYGATFGKQADAGADGRGRSIEVDDGYVSKKHFSVWGERGRWYVQDLGSLNGTFVRRRKRPRVDGDGAKGLDVERCVMEYGYGYEQSMQHGHDGYRLTLHRVFLMGSVEMMVVVVSDEEHGADAAHHHLQLQYARTAHSSPASSASSPSASCDGADSILTATITTSGATIGSASSCSLALSDPTLLPLHATITYSDGRFYLVESDSVDPSSPSTTGVWSRLSLKSEESSPHILCHGDLLRAGFTEFSVDIRAIPPSRSGGYGGGTSGPLTLPKKGAGAYDVGACMEGNFLHTKEMQDRVVCIEQYGGAERNAFFAVFDGHQERTVADFAAAALHHNLLEEIAALHRERKDGGGAPAALAVAAAATDGERTASELSMSASGRIASTTVNDALYNEESRSEARDASVSRSARGGVGRHRRLDSDRSEARIGRDDDDDDEEGDELGTAEVSASASRRPPLSISIHHDPTSVSGTSPSSASSDSTASQKPPTSPAPLPPSQSIDLSVAVTRAYRRTSTQIRGLSESALYSGSTSVTALLYRHATASPSSPSFTSLTIANLGDSHAYLLSSSGISELSYAHSARDPVEQSRVRSVGGKITQNNRLAGCLEVTRAFGDVGLMGFGLSDEPWVKEVRLGDDDRWLLLCSDGVDVLGVKELEDIVREGEREGWDADEIAKEMVERALRRKSRDNISVIVVNLLCKPALPSPAPAPPTSAPAKGLLSSPPPPSHPPPPPPVLPSPRHAKPLHLTLSPPSHSVDAVSSAKLSIITDALHAYHPLDHLSNSAPAVDTDADDERRTTQSQPASGGAKWRDRKDSGWAHEADGDQEAGLREPPPITYSVSSPVDGGAKQSVDDVSGQPQ